MSDEIGPLEALLISIALAKRSVVPLAPNNEDGPAEYVLSARDWHAILECASLIETQHVMASGENPTRYKPE
jgi:hypothetical protein